MLKISVRQDDNGASLVLEGRLEAPWVPELERAAARLRLTSDANTKVTLDLTGLTGMDAVGESALRGFFRRGASLCCADLMNEFFLERITGGAANTDEVACRPCQASPRKATHILEEKKCV